MTPTKRRSLIRTTTAALIAIPFLAPFYFLVAVAFKTEEQYLDSPIAIPTSLTTANLTDAWERAGLGNALINSVIATLIGVAVASLLSMSAGFWFVVHKNRAASKLRSALTFGYAFPAVVWLIPLFVILARNDRTDSLVILGIIYGVSNTPFGLYLLYTFYLQTLKTEILEAAAIDGATTLQQFRLIAIPLARPAAAALAALVFVWSFGDLLFAVTLIQDSDKWTIPIAAVTLVSRQNINPQAQAAAAFVALLPSLAVVLFAQRALVRGFGGGGTD